MPIPTRDDAFDAIYVEEEALAQLAARHDAERDALKARHDAEYAAAKRLKERARRIYRLAGISRERRAELRGDRPISDYVVWRDLARGGEWTAEGQAMRALLFELDPTS